MPTATSFPGLTVTNLGPLTATFTAPSSCITGTSTMFIGPLTAPMDDTWNSQCGPDARSVSVEGCVPSGRQIDDFFATSLSTRVPGLLPYYYPGIACPAGWTTAGVTTRNADGSGGRASGALNLSTPTWPGPDYMPWVTAFAQIVDPGETAAVCCPRSLLRS